jgi:hypothetical protein
MRLPASSANIANEAACDRKEKKIFFQCVVTRSWDLAPPKKYAVYPARTTFDEANADGEPWKTRTGHGPWLGSPPLNPDVTVSYSYTILEWDAKADALPESSMGG